MTENSKEVKSIIKDLQSSDEQIVLNAIKRNRKEGNVKTFRALLETLKNTDEPTVESAIIEFLFDLKDQRSVDVLVEKLEDNSLKAYNSFFIAAFWQASIDGAEHLSLFVQKAIEEDYMVALEALTVVENFDSTFTGEELINCEADLNEAISAENMTDKKALLESLKEVIIKLPREEI